MAKRILRFSFFLVVFVITGCKAESSQPEEFVKLNIIRADIVSDTLPGLVPWIAKAENGDWIVCSFDKNDMITGASTNFVRSSDQGRTWSKPYLSMKSHLPKSQLLGMIQSLPDGRLAAGITDVELADNGQRYYHFFYAVSTNNGLTFDERQRLNDPNSPNDFAQGSFVKLPNGDLFWPWGRWSPDPYNGFRRSVDAGKTWQPAIKAWQDPPNGEKECLIFNETAVVVCKDKSLVAIARTDKKPEKKFWQIKSSNNGKTWTMPIQLELAGGSPALYCMPNGLLLFAFRDAGNAPGIAIAASKDNGDSWKLICHLKDPTGEFEKLYSNVKWSEDDLKKAWRPAEGMAGYPCFLPVSENQVYVVFHLYNKKLLERFGSEADPFYIAGNLIQISE